MTTAPRSTCTRTKGGGERITITLRSTEFDAELVLGLRGSRHGVGTALTRDDDSGGGRGARIDFALPNDGEYVIRANALLPGTGDYLLEVESSLEAPTPPVPARATTTTRTSSMTRCWTGAWWAARGSRSPMRACVPTTGAA